MELETNSKPIETKPLSSLAEIDLLYVVLRRNHKLFNSDNSFEDIRERLTFLYSLLDPVNEDGLTPKRTMDLLVSAYYGSYCRYSDARPPSIVLPIIATKQITMPSFTTQQIEDAY